MRSSETMRIRRRLTLPDNSRFYYLAYAAATVIYAGYALMLLARWKRLKSAPTRDKSE